MNKVHNFPTFHFSPINLKAEVQRIQKKYKHGDRISQNLTLIKLPDLLAKIRNLNNSDKEIVKFAHQLKPIDINILSTEFPYEQENKDTVNKIIIILMERYNRIVGKRFWQHFQLSPSNIQIKNMLQHVFSEEDNNYLGLKPQVRDQYNKIFSSSYPKVNQIALVIGNEKRLLEESFADWKVEKGSKLSLVLWESILLSFIKDRWFVDLQGEHVIEEKLKNMGLDHYKKVIHPYLETLEFDDYHHQLFIQLINRLQDPRINMYRWEGFSTEVIEKVKSRLVRDEMFKFFGTDSERFNYWRRYINFVEDIDFIEDPPIVAMYFGEFVVVEFAKLGNAAYFYMQEGFSKHLAHKLQIYVNESELKNRYTDYYIHKLNHSGNWVSRYDEYMANYLRGNLYYRH